MSRYILKSDRYTVAYGYDNIPGGGYFFQVYDQAAVIGDDEGLIINEGYDAGLGWLDMFSFMCNILAFDVKPTEKTAEHIMKISNNQPI